nr:hypothetical protein BaRGS_004872 [Batillaria attramentaria]
MTSKASVKGFRIGTWQQIVVNSKLVGIGGVSFWVSQFLSAVIACERCFCVLAPLRANGVLKTRTMAVIIAVGSLLIAGAKAVSMEKHRIECVLDVEVNITRLVAMSTEFYTQNKAVLDIWDGLLNILSFPNIVGKIASMFVVDFAPNAGPDSSTDFMGTDSAVDPDHNPLDLEAKEHQLNTEKDAAACQGQGEGIMQRPPIEGGAADGDNKDTASAKDTGQGTEEAAAEPSVIDESKVDEVRLGLVSVESPDGQRAWLGRNPRKAIQRPHLAGLPTGAQMPAIQRKALER